MHTIFLGEVMYFTTLNLLSTFSPLTFFVLCYRQENKAYATAQSAYVTSYIFSFRTVIPCQLSKTMKLSVLCIILSVLCPEVEAVSAPENYKVKHTDFCPKQKIFSDIFIFIFLTLSIHSRCCFCCRY